ncbi:MAG TPA: SDR family oxidoreductase [Longimicrobiaceae bacterium]|nr:SDR family oxidoreductase [Longimicrobiaceae bacterium]
MTNKVVLVTGGAGNLGRAVTRAFLEADSRVAVPLHKTDKPDALDQLQSEFPDRLHTFALDLTTERGAEQAVRQTVEWGGRVDAVAHLIGSYIGGARIGDTALAAWDRMMELNLKSAFLTARFAVPRMVQDGGGSIVFVSSRAAVRERAGHAAYAISKAGLLTLVEALAEEYGDEGVRANAVLPGTVDTEANRRAMPDADPTLWTTPDEIASVIVFLSSADSGAINGAGIPVYGRS